MAGNSFGQLFRITTFGESHGEGIGVVIDGCPAGMDISTGAISKDLRRRRPGQSKLTTQRTEDEEFKILSGIFEGKTTGMPITIFIPNKDARPKDYERFKDVYRPSHADFTYRAKYGIHDYRGGGRSSARETAARVAAGSVAKQLLEKQGVRIVAYTDQIGTVTMNVPEGIPSLADIENSDVRCPDPQVSAEMVKEIEHLRKEKDSTGGTIRCHIINCPPGLGEPVFDRFEADLAKAMLSINATKGFEIGSGFGSAQMRGSSHNDEFFTSEAGEVRTRTNSSGGTLGGITNGENIYFRVAFKPVATIAKIQNTINTGGEEVQLEGKGRHDPCVVPRAVPIVEAMAALVTADHLLRNKATAPFPRGEE